MTLLEKARNLIGSLDTNEFYRNAAIFIGINVLLMLGIVWFYYSRTTSLQGSLREIYKKEYEAKGLLERLKEVKKQSEEVNTLLEQDKNFKIKNFFDDTVKKLNLSANQRGDAKVSAEAVLRKRYTEVTIQAQLQRINTKQLCDLLQAIEQKARIYTKELTITKMKGATLAVTLTIATLTAQTEKKK
jgi:hypothetical protein